eukprot:160214_1
MTTKTMIVYTDQETVRSTSHPRPDMNSDPLQLSGLIKSRTHATPAWMSCNFRLDDVCVKMQTFTVTGWINVIWQEPNTTDLHEELMRYSTKPSIKHSLSRESDGDLEKLFKTLLKDKNVWWYRDNDVAIESEETSSDDCMRMRILDLRESDCIAYYLPIDPTRIFYQSTIKETHHKDPPYLIFNPNNGVIRTAYHVSVSLCQILDLYWFPFDKQCLNIKIRWNKMHYKLLQWQTKDNKIPIDQSWFDSSKTKVNMYDAPLKLSVVTELQNDITMHEPHFDFRISYPGRVNTPDTEWNVSNRLRFALISVRFTRNSTYYLSYILFPVFAIVVCSFSIYAIDRYNIVERLNVSVTILLTFTAFQNVTNMELPNTCFMEFIDIYILIAYVIQMLIIAGSILSSFGQYPEMSDHLPGRWNLINEKEAFWIDMIFGLSLFITWAVVSILYVCFNRLFQFRSCCYKDKHVKEFWERKEQAAKSVWSNMKNPVQTIYSNPKVNPKNNNLLNK